MKSFLHKFTDKLLLNLKLNNKIKFTKYTTLWVLSIIHLLTYQNAHGYVENNTIKKQIATEYVEFVLNHSIQIPEIAGQISYTLMPGFLYINEFYPDIVGKVYQKSIENLLSFYPQENLNQFTQNFQTQNKIYAAVGLFRVLFTYMTLDESFTHIIAFDADPNVNAAHGILRLLLNFSDTPEDFFTYLINESSIDRLIQTIQVQLIDENILSHQQEKLKSILITFQKLYNKHIIHETKQWAFGNEAGLRTSLIFEWLEHPLPNACFQRLKDAAQNNRYTILNICIGQNEGLIKFIDNLHHHLPQAKLGILDVSNTISTNHIDIHSDNDYFNPDYLTINNKALFIQIIDWIIFIHELLASGLISPNAIVISTEITSVDPDDPDNQHGIFCHSGWPMIYGGFIPSKNTFFQPNTDDIWGPDIFIKPIPNDPLHTLILKAFTTSTLGTFLPWTTVLTECQNDITQLWSHFLPIGYLIELLKIKYPESLTTPPNELIILYTPQYFKTREKPNFYIPETFSNTHSFDDPFNGSAGITITQLISDHSNRSLEELDNMIRENLNPMYHIELWTETRALPSIHTILSMILYFAITPK